MPKIYDGFAFFNEMDLLELRLEHLSPVVDHFILVEATRTFQKKPKPLYYQENKKRFERFHDKIIHVVIDEFPTFWTKFRRVTTWHYDNHQKEGILQGLKDAAPDDVVIVSDLDEIPFRDKVLEYRDKPGIRVFEQFQAYYFLNYICTHIHDYDGKAVAQRNRAGYGRWRGSVMLEKKLIKDIKKTRTLHDEEGPHIQVIENGGWHYSFMGGVEKILYKMQSWTHPEYNDRGTLDQVVDNIMNGRDLIGDGNRFELMDLTKLDLPLFPEVTAPNSKYKSLLRSAPELEAELKNAMEQLKGKVDFNAQTPQT